MADDIASQTVRGQENAVENSPGHDNHLSETVNDSDSQNRDAGFLNNPNNQKPDAGLLEEHTCGHCDKIFSSLKYLDLHIKLKCVAAMGSMKAQSNKVGFKTMPVNTVNTVKDTEVEKLNSGPSPVKQSRNVCEKCGKIFAGVRYLAEHRKRNSCRVAISSTNGSQCHDGGPSPLDGSKTDAQIQEKSDLSPAAIENGEFHTCERCMTVFASREFLDDHKSRKTCFYDPYETSVEDKLRNISEKLKRPGRVPRYVREKVHGKVPANVTGKVPGKVPAKVTGKVPAKVPAKVSRKAPGKVPAKVTGKVPGKVPRKAKKVPAKVKGKVEVRRFFKPTSENLKTPPFQCDDCGRTFSMARYVMVHHQRGSCIGRNPLFPKTVPTSNSKPVPYPNSEPIPTSIAQPTPTSIAKPTPTPISEPVPYPVSDPIPTSIAQPIPTSVSEAIASSTSQPIPAPVSKPIVITPVVEAQVSRSFELQSCHDGKDSEDVKPIILPDGSTVKMEKNDDINEHEFILNAPHDSSNELNQIMNVDHVKIEIDSYEEFSGVSSDVPLNMLKEEYSESIVCGNNLSYDNINSEAPGTSKLNDAKSSEHVHGSRKRSRKQTFPVCAKWDVPQRSKQEVSGSSDRITPGTSRQTVPGNSKQVAPGEIECQESSGAMQTTSGETAPSDFICDVCEQKFDGIDSLEKHKYSEVHYDCIFACHNCNSRYVSLKLLESHMEVQHKLKKEDFFGSFSRIPVIAADGKCSNGKLPGNSKQTKHGGSKQPGNSKQTPPGKSKQIFPGYISKQTLAGNSKQTLPGNSKQPGTSKQTLPGSSRQKLKHKVSGKSKQEVPETSKRKISGALECQEVRGDGMQTIVYEGKKMTVKLENKTSGSPSGVKLENNIHGSTSVVRLENKTSGSLFGVKLEDKTSGSTSVVKLENKASGSPSGYECESCGMRFERKLLFEAHVLLHGESGSSDFVCGVCKQKFDSVAALEKHKYAEIHYNSIFACHLCDCQYVSQKLLESHIQIRHKTKKEYPCSFCKIQFVSDADRDKHMITHLSPLHLCKICDHGFLKKENLEKHYKRRHSEGCVDECWICHEEFGTSNDLTAHMHSHRMSSFSDYLPSHMKDHVKFNFKSQQLHVCNICELGYRRINAVTTHSLTHKRAIHACSWCGVEFSSHFHLLEHAKKSKHLLY